MMSDSEQRERLTEGIYLPKDTNEALGRLERAFKAVKRTEAIDHKIRTAVANKVLPKRKMHDLYEEAVAKGIITADDKRVALEAEQLAYDAILVDDFGQEEYVSNQQKPPVLKMASSD
jgi:acyl-CoA dehydrogenase